MAYNPERGDCRGRQFCCAFRLWLRSHLAVVASRSAVGLAARLPPAAARAGAASGIGGHGANFGLTAHSELPQAPARRPGALRPFGTTLPQVASSVGRLAAGVARGKQPARARLAPCVRRPVLNVRAVFFRGCCLRRPGSLQGVASTAQGATPVGRAFTQQQERQQRNYLRQHMCARDSRIPRLRRDNDGRAEQFEFPVSVLSGS